jgi:hypothetical protein
MGSVPGRECGDCSACCTELLVNAPDFRKLAGVRCANLCGDRGCAIYATRPGICGDFECGWLLLAGLGDAWRPDRCGIVLLPKTKGNPAGYLANNGIQIMIVRRDAIYNKELPGLIAACVTACVPLFLTVTAPVGYHAKTTFLNEVVEGAVRDQDRQGLVEILEALVEGLQLQKSHPVDFAAMPPASA